MKIFVTSLFIITYLLVFIFPRRRSFISSISAVLLVVTGALTGVFPLGKALMSINWNVMGIFFGTLIMADLFIESRAPAVLAERLVNLAGHAGLAIFFICLLSGFISAFVENVATVLIVAPIAFALCHKVHVNPVVPIIGIAISSNLQGTATLIGDPPSMLLAAYTRMTFNDFFIYRGRPGIFFAVQIGAVFSFGVLWLFFRRESTSVRLEHISQVRSWTPVILIVAMVVLLALSSFADPGFSYLSGLICMILGILGFVWYVVDRKGPVRKFLSRIDYDTMVFLIGIFIIVGAMTELGLIGIIARKVSRLTGQSRFLAFCAIVGGSVLISAVVDNVPYLMAMLPVVARIAGEHSAVLGGMADYRPLLFFGLLIGACLGGNITPVGASANIVGCGLLKKHGYHVSFWEYFRVGLPFTIAAVVPAAIFLWLVWAR